MSLENLFGKREGISFFSLSLPHFWPVWPFSFPAGLLALAEPARSPSPLPPAFLLGRPSTTRAATATVAAPLAQHRTATAAAPFPRLSRCPLGPTRQRCP